MAAAIGRLTGILLADPTGSPAVALSTLGPGATNLVTAAAYAQLGGMPLFMLTGQKPIRRSKQGHFQIINVVEMLEPLTKFTRQIVSGFNIPSLVRESFRLACEERPGATHLELPEDIAREMIESAPLKPALTRRPIAEQKAIDQAVEMLAAAKHPLILIGAGANRKRTGKMIAELIEKTGIPFINTQMGKGVVSEASEKFIGTTALSTKDFVHWAAAAADVILNLGHDVVEKPPFFMETGKHATRVIHVNFYAAKVDNVYFPQLEVVGDIANAVWQIKEALAPQATWNFTEFFRVKTALEQHRAELALQESFPITPARLVKELRDVLPSDGIVSLDNGVYKIWFARHYPALEQNTLLLDNALATMGAGLPVAMGARLVYPDFSKKIVAVCGDGGFMMNSQELETCVREKLDLVVIILNDGSYGMIRWKQDAMELPDFGLQFSNPDFVKYAEAYGAHGHRPSSHAEFQAMLRHCLETPGVHLIDLPVDYAENKTVLNHTEDFALKALGPLARHISAE